MRKILILLTIIVILPLFSLNSYADEAVDEYISDFENLLPEGYEGMNDVGSMTEAAELKSLLSAIIASASGGRGDIGRFFLLLVGVVALTSLASFSGGRLSYTVEPLVGVICSVSVFYALRPIIDMVRDGIDRLGKFFSSLIPIMAGITALGGGSSTATVQAGGMYTAFALVGGVGGEIFLTLSAFGLAAALLSSLGGEGIASVCRGVKGLFGWITGLFTALITAAFSLQTLVASIADSAAMRAIKYAASGLIPVVGSTVSGAISTLASGVSYAKGVVGTGAILVIIYMAISPLVLLLSYRLTLSLGLILADTCGSKASSNIFTAFRYALDMTVTAYALSALIYLFEIILFIKVGVSLL